MYEQFRNKKGISAGTASVLVIIMAVAVIIVVVVWDTRLDLVIGAESAESGKIKIESVEFSGNSISLCMFNSTDSDRFIVAEYHNRSLVSNTLHIPLPAQRVSCVLLSDVYALGDEVILKIDDGTKIVCWLNTFIPEKLMLENYLLSGCILTVCVRNNLDKPFIMDAVYQNNILICCHNVEISGKSTVCFTLEGCYNVGDNVMLAAMDGTKIIFTIE